ncbi:MAG: ABC transporter ATP-binding protein [Eggerthellaceae bacterium]|jgi:energy-coupling factor transporter ATP-binding protein EcfA2
MAQFALSHLTFTYPGAPEPALDNVSLEIAAGSYVVLCGKSGCGKTTLLRHLKSVLVPHGERNGQVVFEGQPLDAVDARVQSARIGFVMQDPDAAIVTDKVWHELAFGLESLGCDQRTMRLRVAEMASYFGIQQWFHRDVKDLSGGEKQLLCLASIMVMQPRVLILDEPTSQLDPIAASNFLNTILKINRDLGTTIILSEHRLQEVFPVADRVVVMDCGRLIADGDPRTVGSRLCAEQHDMAASVPTPMRIYLEVSPDSPGSATACPLTVREGRAWLERATGDRADSTAALPAEPPVPEDFTPVVQAKEVWMRYERDLPDVLRDVNLRVPPGVLLAVVGGNGTGKSTLLRTLAGVEKAYRGSVKVEGRKVSSYRAHELYRGLMGLLPQDPANLLVAKTVEQDLRLMFEGQDLSDAEVDEQVHAMAQRLDLSGLLDRHPLDLSAGEQQRAALAKVLLGKPRILLLDEPTKGIDECFKGRLARLFAELKDQGVTIIMASHDIEFCARYADLVSMMFDGSIVATNTPRRFFSGNGFYTTAASRMSRTVFPDAVTDEEVIRLCRAM